MRIRIKFARNEFVQYLGHLDIMRTFQRCFNRAGIRMLYSEGFNPHQKMSFALPLGVGVLSTGEYLDAEIADGQNADEIRNRLNEVCGAGFEILDVREVEEGADKVMAAVCYASYEIVFVQEYDLHIDEYMDRPSIILTKKTKTGTREVDLKKAVREIRMEHDRLFLLLECSNENSIRPELITEDLFAFNKIHFERDLFRVTRTDLYAQGLIPLIEYQTIR